MVIARILGYPLLFLAALELFLGYLLLKNNPRRSSVNRSVAIFSFFSAAFSLSTAIMYVRHFMGLDYNLFARLSWFGWFTVPAAIQTVFNLDEERSRRGRIVGFILYPFWGIAALLTLTTELVVTDQYRLFPLQNLHGPLEDPLRLTGGLLILWLIYLILRLRRKVRGIRRAQLDNFFYGTIIFGLGGAIVAGFMPLLGQGSVEPGLAAYFSLPWVLMTFYAITRYRLFDIRLVLSRFLGILLLTLVISSLHFILFKALEPTLGAVFSIFISIPIIGFVLFGTPLSRNMQRWVNEIVLGERLVYQRMLKESAAALIRILDLDELQHFMIDSVREGLKVERACVFLRNDRGAYASVQCFRTAGLPSDNLDLTQDIVFRMKEEMAAVIRDELNASPSAYDIRMGAELGKRGIDLLVPLISKGRLLGALALGARSSGEPYLQSDIDLIQTLANHAAIAAENAQLFEESGRMRASLREQEGMFRALAQTLPAAIFIHRGGKFLYANPAGTKITGYSMEEILNMDFWDLIHADFRDLVHSRGKERLEGGSPPPQYEFKIMRKDGSDCWVLMTAGSIEYEGKEAVIGTIFDITERKRVEEALRESEGQFRALAETMEAAVLIHAGGKFLYTNPAAARLTKYSERELRQTDFWVIAHPAYRELIWERGKARISGQDPPAQYEFKVIRKDGVERWALASMGRIVYRQQQAVISTLLDITAQKAVEDALRESEERFRQVSETAQEWIWEVDEDGRYTYSSPVVMDILGYHPDEVVGKKFFYDLFDPEDREQLKRVAFGLFERKEVIKGFRNLNRHKDGREIILSKSGMPVLDQAGNLIGYRGVDVDITGQIQSEQERVRLYEESVDHYQALLDEQQRHQQEKEKILKDLHDGIGGLTTNINLLAELARASSDLESIKRSLATIAELSRESLSEIRGFIQSLDERELNWHAIAAEFRHLGSTIIEPHGIQFAITTSLTGDGAPSSSIAMSLFRIYKESLANIVKHAKASNVCVSLVQKVGEIVLAIGDNGVGLKETGPKTGRGVPNMKARAEDMGGTFSLETGNGTTITITVPIP